MNNKTIGIVLGSSISPEYLIKSALNKYPEIKNNEVFKTYINQNKINNF